MVGSSMLVKPVTAPSTFTVDVTFPQGSRWYDATTGAPVPPKTKTQRVEVCVHVLACARAACSKPSGHHSSGQQPSRRRLVPVPYPMSQQTACCPAARLVPLSASQYSPCRNAPTLPGSSPGPPCCSPAPLQLRTPAPPPMPRPPPPLPPRQVNLNGIPVYYRGGSVVPRRERPRRSTAAQLADPYTLVVAADDKGEAEGQLYVDDGRSFAFQRGLYLHR